MLTRQLAARFGQLEPGLEQRITGASDAVVERWALRLLDSSSLDEVFADDSVTD